MAFVHDGQDRRLRLDGLGDSLDQIDAGWCRQHLEVVALADQRRRDGPNPGVGGVTRVGVDDQEPHRNISYPTKGALAVGSDADMVIWEPRREVTVTNAMLHHNVDYTPCEGMQLTGWPETTISRGVVVCDGGELKAEIGRGRFLRCATPETATLASTA